MDCVSFKEEKGKGCKISKGNVWRRKREKKKTENRLGDVIENDTRGIIVYDTVYSIYIL